MSRVPLLILAVIVAGTPCHAANSSTRDGSTKEKAIRLIQRDPSKAVEEEVSWMMKLHHYTPILATHDLFADILRRFKAGTKNETHPPAPWGHATIEHKGHWLSNWWFRRPNGRNIEMYFDTGASVKTPGEVPRQESARAQYMGQKLNSLNGMRL